MISRLERLMKKLPFYECDKKVDAAMIFSEINRMYFSGFKSSNGVILLTRNECYFITDFRYYEAAINNIKNMKVVIASDLKKDLLEIIKKHNIKNILLECNGLSLAESLKFEKWIEKENVSFIKSTILEDIISSIRSIKENKELKNIKVAQEISEKALNELLSTLKPGMREKEIAFNLEILIRKEGAEATSFDLIVASGKNSSMPHAVPTDKPLENGDFITIDMGAVYNGYRSDMTRTVALGRISEKQRSVYNLVLAAQNKAIKSIKSGVLCKKIDKIVRCFIYENGYEGCFGHALGHGVGLEIHESPFLSARSKQVLKSGMVVTIEPGIYLKNEFGVRIEDIVVVTEQGCQNLTFANKELVVI